MFSAGAGTWSTGYQRKQRSTKQARRSAGGSKIISS